VITFPNCKINLGLRIIGKREDGFHNLETCFYPLSIKDVLEIIQSTESKINFQSSGLAIDGDTNDNLCVKAYHLLKKDFPQLPTIHMQLHKNIPMGAGLGGGSADGAFTLKLLNDKFHLQLSTHQLIEYALQLGSDCPFFILNQPCIATSRGEVMTPLQLDLSNYQIMIINSGIYISTAWAFKNILPRTQKKSIQTIIQQPIETWKEELHNDFELPVMKTYPSLQTIKEQLYSTGAIYAAMSGSGSTFYGIYTKEINPSFDFPENYFIKKVDL
jgi:4-diphosphocytidyl-2-C-methyl-D-erythritol kinase